VLKKYNSILIIFIILAVVGICGCITIKEVDYEQYLKDSSFYRPSVTPTPTVSAAGMPGGDQTGEILPNKGGKFLTAAIEDLYMQNVEGLIEADNVTYYQVMGTGVGIEGRADSWLIGGRKDGETRLLTYSDRQWRNIVWPGPLSEDEIILENILLPEELFTKNRDLLTDNYLKANVSYSDLFLKDGEYSIAIRDNNRIIELKFKADTGELI